MTRHLRLIAAMALARVASAADGAATRLAQSVFGADEAFSTGAGDIAYFNGEEDEYGAPEMSLVSETGITRALAETEEL